MQSDSELIQLVRAGNADVFVTLVLFSLDDIEDAYLKLSISPHHRLRQKAGDRPILDVKLPLPKKVTEVKSAVHDLYELAKERSEPIWHGLH